MKRATMVVELERDLLIAIHTADAPTEDDFREYVALTLRQLDDQRDLGTRPRQLVFTDGGAPSLKQRKAAAETLGGRSMPVAVVSSSGLVRFVVTALTLANPQIRAFSPDSLDEAFRYLDIKDRKRVHERIARLRADLASR